MGYLKQIAKGLFLPSGTGRSPMRPSISLPPGPVQRGRTRKKRNRTPASGGNGYRGAPPGNAGNGKKQRTRAPSGTHAAGGGYPRKSHGTGRKQRRNRSRCQSGGQAVIAYHGTPSTKNAGDILRNGFMVGHGNVYGDGIYFTTDANEAKGYAGSGGVYLRCRIGLGKTCNWDNGLKKQFQQWCKRRRVDEDQSAQTAFLLARGFDTLRSGSVVVVLQPQYANPSAHKRKLRRVRILSVHRASDGRRIRV